MKFKPYLVRLGIALGISLLFVVLFNEVTFILQKDQNDRAPETIEIVIPPGTSEKLEEGVEIVSLPSNMVFVLGDTLFVKNEDSIDHQLGPIWVPPGTNASLVLNRAEKLAYSCSFQNSRYLDLDVREPTTINTRLIGIGVAAPTLAALLFVYSIAIWPVHKETNKKPNEKTGAGEEFQSPSG